MSTANKTPNLSLPQYTGSDKFDLEEINKGYLDIDSAYKEIIDFREEIPKVNASAEIIEARDGEKKLYDKIKKIDSSLEDMEKKKDNFKIINLLDFKINNQANWNVAYDNVIAYINSSNDFFELYIPSGEYEFNNYTIKIDTSKYCVRGEYLTTLKSVGLGKNKNFVEIFNTFNGIQAWDFMKKPISNLRIEGMYFTQNDLQTNNICGLSYVATNGNATKSSPHDIIENVVIENFNIGLYSSYGAFKQAFYNCSFIMNDIGILFDEASGYGCVPIHFYGCFLEANNLAINLKNKGTGEVHFIGGSIEYNARLVETYDNISFRDMHIEFDLQMAKKCPIIIYGDNEKSKLTFDNCWFFGLPNGQANLSNYYQVNIFTPPQNLFEVNISNQYYLGAYALLVNNCTFNFVGASKITSNELIGGTSPRSSVFNSKLDGTLVTDKTIISSSLNLWYNKNFASIFNQFKDIIIVDSDTSPTNASGSGSNITLSVANNELNITKNSGTKCKVGFLIKVNNNDNGYLVNLTSKMNKDVSGNCSIDVAEMYADYTNSYSILSTTFTSIASTSLNKTTSYVTSRLKLRKPSPHCNCILLTLNMNGITDTSFSCLVNELIVNRY